MWEKIETAPKDGKHLLLYFPDGYWRDDRKIAIGFWSGGWFEGEADSHSMTAFGQHPTHWHPLPEPPRED